MTCFGQPKFRDLAADHAAGRGFAVEDHDVIAERREVARDSQRGGAGADQRDALAVAAAPASGRRSLMSPL